MDEINWYKVININLWAHGKSILTIHKQNITKELYEQIIRNKLWKSTLTIHKKEIDGNLY